MDNTPPIILSATTSTGNSNIGTQSDFIINLNEPVQLSSTWTKYFRIYDITDQNNTFAAGIGYPTNATHFTLSSDRRQITFHPRVPGNIGSRATLNKDATVALWIKAGAFEDLSGNKYIGNGIGKYQFTTEASSPCSVSGVSHAANDHDKSFTMNSGASLTIACLQGYQLSGTGSLSCNEGIVSGSAICSAISCTPTQVANSDKSEFAT